MDKEPIIVSLNSFLQPRRKKTKSMHAGQDLPSNMNVQDLIEGVVRVAIAMATTGTLPCSHVSTTHSKIGHP